jgi:hypothetical protein
VNRDSRWVWPEWLSLERLSNWLTFGVVIIAFALSFGALEDLAREVGIIYPALYPIMIDAGLVIYNIMALQSSLDGERNWYAWLLIVLATVASVFLNVVHAADTLPTWLQTILGPAMAAIPPLVIFGAFHLVVLRIEETARRTRVLQSLSDLNDTITDKRTEFDMLIADKQTELDDLRDKIQREIDDLTGQRGKLISEIEQLKRTQSHLTVEAHTPTENEYKSRIPEVASNGTANSIDARREKVRIMLAEDMNKKDIATALGVSVKTINRDIHALNGRTTKGQDTND